MTENQRFNFIHFIMLQELTILLKMEVNYSIPFLLKRSISTNKTSKLRIGLKSI
jgi:hypothetical protein